MGDYTVVRDKNGESFRIRTLPPKPAIKKPRNSADDLLAGQKSNKDVTFDVPRTGLKSTVDSQAVDRVVQRYLDACDRVPEDERHEVTGCACCLERNVRAIKERMLADAQAEPAYTYPRTLNTVVAKRHPGRGDLE